MDFNENKKIYEEDGIDLRQEVWNYCLKEFHYDQEWDAFTTTEQHPNIIREDLEDMAKHFYELGKKNSK